VLSVEAPASSSTVAPDFHGHRYGFARLLGISQATVSKIESPLSRLRHDTAFLPESEGEQGELLCWTGTSHRIPHLRLTLSHQVESVEKRCQLRRWRDISAGWRRPHENSTPSPHR
jgi:hypothetical protein